MEFSSITGLDLMSDEPLIDEIFLDEVCDIIYDHTDNFTEYVIDFGGGIVGITCRSILYHSEGKAAKLAKLLDMTFKNARNQQWCTLVLQECKKALRDSAFGGFEEWEITTQ